MIKLANIDTEALKEAAPIIDYIKKYYPEVEIDHENSTLAMAKCCFHNENTASLALYANGTFKCFGCGEHGDIITFVQKMENTDFIGACKIIADNVGFKLNYVSTNPEVEKYEAKMAEYVERYQNNLKNNANALNYLINTRHITPEMIDKFKLGLTDYQEYKYRSDMGNISNRIVFPIFEHTKYNPQCVGMAYRALGDEKPKYINDRNQDGENGNPEALKGIFIKGNMLYGMAQAMSSISRYKFVYVVEGYMDVISMHQAGLTNTVGIMGTSMTSSQIEAIRKTTDNVFLLLDSDRAGRTSEMKYIQQLLESGMKIVIMKDVTDYKDPDEMCKAFDYNTQMIRSYLNDNSVDAVHYIIRKETEHYHTVTSVERRKAYTKIMPVINSIQDENMRRAYTIELSKELN